VSRRWSDWLWFPALGISVVILFFITGCGGSSTGSTAPTTAPVAAAAKVTALEVAGSVPCNGATNVTIPVTYATEGAARQELYVDGRPVPLPDPAGTVEVALHCDQLPHSVVVIAYDADDRRTPRAAKVTTVL